MATKKVVKLNRRQLRGLIAEAIQHRPLGEAEQPYRTTRGLSPAVDDMLETMGEMVEKHFDAGGYNPDDPSMAHLGPEAWAEQVDAAVKEFVTEAEALFERINQKLIDGEYYDGN